MRLTATGNPEQVRPAIPSPAHESPLPRGLLVVDDEEGVRRIVGLAMRGRGFEVWLASGGDEAAALYREHRSAIDLVLLDVQMPGRDGPGTLAALREIDPDVRFCFVTGGAGRYSEEALLALGASRVFWKPFRLTELAQQLKRVATPVDRPDPFPGEREPDDGGGGCDRPRRTANAADGDSPRT
jgi:two-component system OmpR family response regulator